MSVNKALIISIMVLMSVGNVVLLSGEAGVYTAAGESIQYLINPIGESVYNDLGMVSLKGSKVDLATFTTKVLSFEDKEKIYSDPESLLPIRVERDISNLWGKERIIEEYDQKMFTVTLRKYDGDKLIYERTTRASGPIYNAITLPFCLRRAEGLKIGWHTVVRLPEGEYKMTLASIDEITVPAGRFQVYHFKSIPDKFEIWIDKNDPRAALKIQGKGIYDYALSMKSYSPRQPS